MIDGSESDATSCPAAQSDATTGRRSYRILIAMLCGYACVLGFGAFRMSPVWHDSAQLLAGLTGWKFQRFDTQTVNPPLPRMVATLPALAYLSELNLDRFDRSSIDRREFAMGASFLDENPNGARTLFLHAKLCCLLFPILAAFTCRCFSEQLFSLPAGSIALLLWCGSPSILGNSLTLLADIPAAAMGIIAVLLFWRWLRETDSANAIIAGLLLGLAELCKFTLLVFYPLFVLMWAVYRLSDWRPLLKQQGGIASAWRESGQLLLMFVISVFVINSGYLFEGTFTPLGEYRFQTTALTGCDSLEDVPVDGANRFEGTWFGRIPVPLPANMVQGIDTQKLDFERGLSSYLQGQHADHGWWYYYLYALVVKMPLGTWGLLAIAVFCTVFLNGYNSPWRDEMVIVLPGLALFVFVSSQTGFSAHSRYIIPALPFLFIWISRVGRAFSRKQLALYPRSTRVVRGLTVFFLGCMIISSLWIYPHSLSYFNELAAVLRTPQDDNYPEALVTKADAGSSLFMAPFRMLDAFFTAGPKNGPRHLLDSNIDWGQDLFYLEEWYEAHAEARPFRAAYWGSFPLDLSKIDSAGYPPVGPDTDRIDENTDLLTVGPLPGYYALSVNEIYGRSKQYRYFLHFEPVATAGYSIYIYHITRDEANRVRRELGLPKIDKEEHIAEGDNEIEHQIAGDHDG